jgi:hypothetical protein
VSVVHCLLIAAEMLSSARRHVPRSKTRHGLKDSPAPSRQPWALLLSILRERIARTVTAGAALEAQGGARAAACHTEGARA